MLTETSTKSKIPLPVETTIRRYLLLTEKIIHGFYPSFNELQDYLDSHDIEISKRTLQRDIKHVREEYGIEIEYDHAKNGYKVNQQKSINVNEFLKFLGIVNTAHVLTDSLKDSRESLNYLDFDSVHLFKGRDYIKDILFAIRNKRVLGFGYSKFDKDGDINLTIKPYLLKEYQYRWYMVGIIEGDDIARNYGLDRITRLDVLPETFGKDEKDDVREIFAHTVGLNFNEGKPEKITIQCEAMTGRYLETLPIHSSQDITERGDTHWTITYFVRPNFEFRQKLLMHLPAVEILEPASLRNHFIEILKDGLKKHE